MPHLQERVHGPQEALGKVRSGFFFNRYAALEATWAAGKLSFEFENLSFDNSDLSFEILSLSFDNLDSINLIHTINWSQFSLFRPKYLL